MAHREIEESRARGVMNQRAAKRLNDEIARSRYSASFDSYVCECRSKKCLAPIKLTRAEYLEIRRDPRRFVVLPGHSAPKLERTVLVGSGFHVIVPLEQPASTVVEPGSPTRDGRSGLEQLTGHPLTRATAEAG